MRPVVKAKKTTREIVAVYDSAAAAARAEGTSPSRISKRCARRSLGRGDCYYRFMDEFDPNESFERAERYRPVLAVNKLTGHWMWFESAKAASEAFYGSHCGVDVAIRRGRTRRGYAFVYADRRMRAERCEVKA